MIPSAPALEIHSELLRNADGKIRYRKLRAGGYEHYNVRIYVDGSPEALARVESVEYELHPSFPDPHRVVRNRDDNFALQLWCWGTFDIQVTFNLRGGGVETTNYYLRFVLPEDTGDNYVEVD